MSSVSGDPVEVPPSSFRSLITPQEMRVLTQPARWRVVRDLILIWAQIAAAVAIYVLHPAWWTFALAFLFVAGGQHGLTLATHEFAHYSLFPENRKLNDVLGKWFFGAPSGVPLAIFRHRHFKHHRTYSTDDDPKHIYKHSLRGVGLLVEIARSLTGWEYLHHAVVAREQHAEASAAGTPQPSPVRALPSLAISQLVILAIFTLVASPWLYFTLWLLPLVTLAHLFHKLRAMMEHRPLAEQWGASPGSGFYGETPGPFVRTVRASWWERLLLCKMNFGYHAEHHLWPQVSYQYLPAMHERLKAAGGFRDPRFGVEANYFSTIYKLWKPTATAEAPPAVATEASR